MFYSASGNSFYFNVMVNEVMRMSDNKMIVEVLDRLFFEDFLKENIINELVNYLSTLEGMNIYFMRGISKPIMTMARWSEEIYKYSLTGVVLYDLNTKETNIYAVDGIVTTLSAGKIRISEYECKPYN